MSFNFSKHDEKLLFLPLGGSNEIGMNLNLYRYKGKWLMIDCGIGFADEYLPGIDVVVPNVDMIADIKKDLLGLVLTHAHEDHHGGVPYLWEEFECPIYATAFTSAMLKSKLGEAGLKGRAKVHEVKPHGSLDIGPFTLGMIPLTHSIPEMQAIAIKTDKGTILHTGDWKLDKTPLVGPSSDEESLKRLGDEGVLAMVCDSTNVFSQGESGSESTVRTHLQEVIKNCENRAIVTTFASNIARLETIIYAGLAAGRKISLAGKSLWRVTGAARECGYLQDVPEFLSDRDAMNVPRDEIMIICTGCQGEGRAALPKMARDEHPAIRLSAKDTVIFSSKIIPGNDSKIGWLHNQLVKRDIDVITEYNAHIHVSGHPCRDELTRMYELVRPQISVPVHGEARHIKEHAYLAKQLGIAEQVEATNGAVIELTQGAAKIIGYAPSGYIAIDGKTMIDTDSPIIRMRRKMRDDGLVSVSVVLDNKTSKPLAAPHVVAPGSLDDKEDAELLADIVKDLHGTLKGLKPKTPANKIEETIRSVIRGYIRRELGKRPPITVQVTRI